MRMTSSVRFLAAGFLGVSFVLSWAQTPNLNPRVPPEKQSPVVKFEYELAGATPPHYSLSIEAGGSAAYRSDENPATDDGGPGQQPYFVKFIISPPTADRIFQLAKALNYFKGNFEYRGGRIANMGAKTLTFKDGATENVLTYNYSQNINLQQLTTLLQGIGSAVEYRRHLEQLYRYEKLGLEQELKQMEEDAKRGYISELQVDESILREIANDPTVLNISRKRAEALLQRIGSTGPEVGRK